MGAPEKRLERQTRALLSHRDTEVSCSAIRTESAEEREPQAVWWALEDLYLRLARIWPLTVNHCDPNITVHGMQRCVAGSASQGELQAAALDPKRYQCDVDGRRRSFLRSIDVEGKNLLLQLTPLIVMERWPQGPELAQQVRGFLVRLEQLSRDVR